ncbi:hypothetical protein MAAFP003_3243 [Mycobacterium ahvazicum]|uniref:Uncharacterized protein n=1 Tax=Mycobacterium ahvazicum TaxID=1964395 RepID=A0A2K4YCS9_9MYCO|nr:hypothetical protein [Mycobacterium ahvazicum]SOX54567.1 hypothetical protein MAAFP003_3243 [Mycobacterium ahvazicum]
MVERERNRIADIAVEAVGVTVLHVRRIVGALHTAVGRAKREIGDLAWDYHELAASVRWSTHRSRTAADDHDQRVHDEHIADVISIDLRRRQAN